MTSISFGGCEANAGSSGVNYWDSLFSQAAGEGISVFVSSGDAGVDGCEEHPVNIISASIAISNFFIATFLSCV